METEAGGLWRSRGTDGGRSQSGADGEMRGGEEKQPMSPGPSFDLAADEEPETQGGEGCWLKLGCVPRENPKEASGGSLDWRGGEATPGVGPLSREEEGPDPGRRGGSQLLTPGQDRQFWTCPLMSDFLSDGFSREAGLRGQESGKVSAAGITGSKLMRNQGGQAPRMAC